MSVYTVSPKEIYQEYYVELVELLPMNDAYFIAVLFSRGLLTCGAKELIESQPTRAHRASVFLDEMIKLKSDSDSFSKLLECMENHDFKVVNELAQRIKEKFLSG